MARKKNPARSSKPVVAAETDAAPAPTPRRAPRDIRPYVYAGFDLLIAAIWAYLQISVMPNRHAWAGVVTWSLAVLPLAAAAAMFLRNLWGWRLASAACAALLVIWVVLLIVILAAAAYLDGVYGSFGKAAAMGTLTMALISFNIIALVPALQLKFLLTRAGRRAFGQEPLWR